MKKAFFILVFLLAVHPARGASLGEVEQYYKDGDFEKTLAAGRELGTKEGLQFALRAQLIRAQYILPPEERLPALAKAIPEARSALARYPDDVELIISTGILIGLRGRMERSVGDGKEARALFEKALELDPDQPWALGALGSWHAETVHEAGAIAARLVMGAKKKHAYAYFDQAYEADPNNLPILAAYIRMIFKLEPKHLAGRLRVLIREVENAEPKNGLDRLMQEQIRQIEAAWLAGDNETLNLLLSETQPLEMKGPE